MFPWLLSPSPAIFILIIMTMVRIMKMLMMMIMLIMITIHHDNILSLFCHIRHHNHHHTVMITMENIMQKRLMMTKWITSFILILKSNKILAQGKSFYRKPFSENAILAERVSFLRDQSVSRGDFHESPFRDRGTKAFLDISLGNNALWKEGHRGWVSSF